jgi:DNA-nicking Smr family endonuclease
MGPAAFTFSWSMRGRRPSREERELWRSAMRDVKAWRDPEPGAHDPAPPPAPAATAEKQRGSAGVAPKSAPVARHRHPALAPGDVVGVDRRLADRLRRGRLPIQSTLDLHGLTQSEAHAAVQGFVVRAAERGLRTVLIVTGKGRRDGVGVLKSALPRWLNETPLRPFVLALSQARPEHGGTGALYVLLKRRRRP